MNDDRRSLTVHDTIHVSDDGGAPDNFSDGDLSVRVDRGYPHRATRPIAEGHIMDTKQGGQISVLHGVT